MEPSNPLYGRIDLTINLKPMDYYESTEFYPSFSEEDRIKIYSVFGGVPYYNRLVDDSISVEENLLELLVAPEARLENEVSMYLNAEISKITNANEVFEALSKGYTKYKDILDQSHVSSGPTLVDVLDKLSKMEVVEKRTPINDEGNKRKASYHISDHFQHFITGIFSGMLRKERSWIRRFFMRNISARILNLSMFRIISKKSVSST